MVSQAMLIKKEYGMVRVLDSFATGIDSKDNTFTGGLVGSLIGILGGPLGVLLGGSLGALVGNTMDVDDLVNKSSLIEKVAEMFKDGETAVVALVQENVDGAVDRAIAMYNPNIVKFDAAEIAEEIRQAEEIEKEMAREAKKRLREERKAEKEQKIAESREKIKAEFDGIKEKFATA